jgi:hypothetical protein
MDKYLIEGSLRLQKNIVKAIEKYGYTFDCKLIKTKYFGDDEEFCTLVCAKDETLILGKPRHQRNFAGFNYVLVKAVDIHKCNLYSLKCIMLK